MSGIIKKIGEQTFIVILHLIGTPLFFDRICTAQFLVVKNNNDNDNDNNNNNNNDRKKKNKKNKNNTWKWGRSVNTRTRIDNLTYTSPMSCYMSFLSLPRSSSSASFKWTTVLVFFWKFIEAARLDGRISKVNESVRNRRAEPEGKKSLCGVKSLHLWYVIMLSYRLK